jgi:uncharacterized membrane protein
MIAMRSTPASRLKLAGMAFVFLWFFVGGIAHFVATETEMRIVPPYIPWPRAAVRDARFIRYMSVSAKPINSSSCSEADASNAMPTLPVTDAERNSGASAKA